MKLESIGNVLCVRAIEPADNTDADLTMCIRGVGDGTVVTVTRSVDYRYGRFTVKDGKIVVPGEFVNPEGLYTVAMQSFEGEKIATCFECKNEMLEKVFRSAEEEYEEMWDAIFTLADIVRESQARVDRFALGYPTE